MDIEMIEVPVRDLVNGYNNGGVNGVFGYDGKLDIRPKYQREFVYSGKQRSSVVDTVRRNFPLNVMYWSVGDNDTFEVIDGQQRTISVCDYVDGAYSIDGQYFHNLTKEEKTQILDYKIMVFLCEGSDREKLDWFEVINTAGELLTEQELLNAVYTGPWLTDARVIFSKPGCPATKMADKYVKGTAIRQHFLRTAIHWISGGNIREYMSIHQHDADAKELWDHFETVIKWVDETFPEYRREMKGVNFGSLYSEFKDVELDSDEIETAIKSLLVDDSVTNKQGAYYYVLTGDEKKLSIRNFTNSQISQAFAKQSGVCPTCGETFELSDMEADHITPWSKGGKTVPENCQMLCKKCNRTKSDV